MMTIQCTIETLDRSILHDLRDYLLRQGVYNTVYTTIYNGVPLYLITAKNSYSYVCTKAIWHYMALLLPCTNLLPKPEAFRVFPKVQITPHKQKGSFATVQYTSISKLRGEDAYPTYSLNKLPIQNTI